MHQSAMWNTTSKITRHSTHFYFLLFPLNRQAKLFIFHSESCLSHLNGSISPFSSWIFKTFFQLSSIHLVKGFFGVFYVYLVSWEINSFHLFHSHVPLYISALANDMSRKTRKHAFPSHTHFAPIQFVISFYSCHSFHFIWCMSNNISIFLFLCYFLAFPFAFLLLWSLTEGDRF
jgi:hypothetical protein